MLNLLIPFDFEEIEELVKFESEALAEHGFTSVLDIATPDYFETLYEDSILGLYNEGELRQRFFGSYLLNRPLQPRMIVHKPVSYTHLLLGILMGVLLGALSVLLFLALLFPLVGIFLPSYCDTVAGWMDDSYFAEDLYNNNLLLILFRDFI